MVLPFLRREFTVVMKIVVLASNFNNQGNRETIRFALGKPTSPSILRKRRRSRIVRSHRGPGINTIPIHKDIRAYNASQSTFEPVWQVLNALRSHDRRLADELDQLRLSLGRRSKYVRPGAVRLFSHWLQRRCCRC